MQCMQMMRRRRVRCPVWVCAAFLHHLLWAATVAGNRQALAGGAVLSDPDALTSPQFQDDLKVFRTLSLARLFDSAPCNGKVEEGEEPPKRLSSESRTELPQDKTIKRDTNHGGGGAALRGAGSEGPHETIPTMAAPEPRLCTNTWDDRVQALPRRALLDSDASSGEEEVTVVRTFQELLEAWTEGAAHIELQGHMDSTAFPLISADINGASFSHVLPPQLESTHTVKGNCQSPPGADITNQLSGVPLTDLKEGQCVILANKHLMPIVTGTVLVDNLYIRYNAPISGSFAGEVAETTASMDVPSLFHSHGGKAWVSNLTVQGDGESPCGALVVYSAAQLQFIDTDFVSLYASVTDAGPKPTALVKESSAVAYLRTRALNITQDTMVPIYGGDSTVKLSFQECEFENNTQPVSIEVVPGATVYSDNRTELVWQDVGSGDPVDPEAALPLSEAQATGAFLSLSDPEYIALRDGAPLEATGGGGGKEEEQEEEEVDVAADGGGLSDGAKIGIGVACALAALAAAGLAVVLWRRRRNANSGDNRGSAVASPTPKKAAINGTHDLAGAGGSSMWHTGHHPPLAPSESFPSEAILSEMDGPTPLHYTNASQRDMPHYSPVLDPVTQHNYHAAQAGHAAAAAHGVPSHMSSQQMLSVQQASQMSILSCHNAPSHMHALMEDGLKPSPQPTVGPSKPTLPPTAPRQQSPSPLGAQQNGSKDVYEPGPARGTGTKPVLEHQQFNSNNSATASAANQMDPESVGARSATSNEQTVTEGHLDSKVSSMSTLGQPPQPTPTRAPRTIPPAVTAPDAAGGIPSVRTYDSVGEVTDICSDSKTVAGSPPAINASMHDKLDFLHCQLDSLRNRQILSGLLLQEGSSNRLVGGQAIVQFATHVLSKVEFAIKFFVSSAAFSDELAQYSDSASPLRVFLPKARDIVPNDDGAFVDARGHPMPPCIVMEKGESLDRWVQRNKRAMDPFTCMQILYHVCECLMDLHKEGYVHRDLKPANIMWLPSQNRWTIIDFGCAAKIDSDARLGFSLMYAAPEVVTCVFRDRCSTMRAATALDAWSVGILAIELFTAKPALRLIEGREKVGKQIMGELPLPWEGPDGGRELLKRAGKLRPNLLRLLHRDPNERLTVDAFVQSCSNMLSTTTQLSAESRDSQLSTSV